MKITVKQLRKIIQEALEEQGWVPGRWYPGSGEPVDGDDLDRLGHGGFRSEEPLEEDDADLGEG